MANGNLTWLLYLPQSRRRKKPTPEKIDRTMKITGVLGVGLSMVEVTIRWKF